MKKFVFFLGIFLFLLGPAFAATAVKLSLEEVVGFSEVVFVGQVVDVQGLRVQGVICSRVTVQVSESLKGINDSWFEFTIPGGEVDGLGLLIPGLPRFKVGEDVFAFLTPQGATGVRVPVGFAQGKYHVLVDPETGEKSVLGASTAGLQLISPATGLPVPSQGPSLRGYDEFVRQVQLFVERGK